MSNFPAPPASWSDVARVCRRVCVLRERGKAEEAEQLRRETLPALIAGARAPGETDASVNERIDAIFATEAERVANASVLAELLLPMLSEQLPGAGAPLAWAADPSPPLSTPLASTPLAPPPPPRAAPGSIADFIDEMIALESEPSRPGPASQRRAS